MSISACMMVRDEEHLLARCLESFQGAWDELIVVDTGSTDATVSIAESFGAYVVRCDACNDAEGRIRDFSLARNTAIEAAAGDWVLWMDADDVLLPGGPARFRAHAAREDAAAVQVTLRWNGDTWFQTRLFRRLPGHRFVGRIHEYPHVVGPIVTAREIVVEHRPDKRGKEGSVDRNLRMCALEVQDDPENLRAVFYYGNALRLAGRNAEAVVQYESYLARGGNFHCERYMAAHFIACCRIAERDWRAAVRAGLEALSIDPRYAETHCLIADAYGELRDYAFAAQWYQSALACGSPPPDAALFVDRSRYGPYPEAGLRICREQLAAGVRVERG